MSNESFGDAVRFDQRDAAFGADPSKRRYGAVIRYEGVDLREKNLRMYLPDLIAQATKNSLHPGVQGKPLSPLLQHGLRNRSLETLGGMPNHFVQIGRNRIPVLRQQGVDTLGPKAASIHADTFQKARRAIGGQGIVKVKDERNDVGHAQLPVVEIDAL